MKILQSEFLLEKQADLAYGLHGVCQDFRSNGKYVGLVGFGNDQRVIQPNRMSIEERERCFGFEHLPGVDLTSNDGAENAVIFH